MKRVEFARLAEISPAMVTKYADQGLLVFVDEKNLDARASLEALAGTLNEDKRQAALEKLAKLDAAAQLRAVNDANGAPAIASAPGAAKSAAKTTKIEIEELKRDSLALELARKAGDLAPIEDVERVILDAMAGLQAAFDQESRAMAAQMTIDLGLSPDKEAILARRLRTLCNRARQRYAAEMQKLASADLSVADAEPAESAAQSGA